MPAPLHPQYSERVVAFVDILGFADLVRRADKDVALRGEIIDALSRVRSVAPPSGGQTDLRAQNFSDSLILSAHNSADGLWHLLLSVDALAWNLLQNGILIRGAVTVGGIHHDDQTVFGVGVNEAYRLESTIAKYPRVILSGKAKVAADTYASQDQVWRTYRDSRLVRDVDGVWFLNFLVELGCFNRQDPSNSDMLQHPLCQTGRDVRDLLQAKLDATVDQPDVYAKIEWMARYWNREVAEHPVPNAVPVIGPLTPAGAEHRTAPLPFRSAL
jgi:hypothetical protein